MKRGRERGVAIFSVGGEQGEDEKEEEFVGLGFLSGLRLRSWWKARG